LVKIFQEKRQGDADNEPDEYGDEDFGGFGVGNRD